MTWTECPICILLLSYGRKSSTWVTDVDFHMQEHAEKKMASVIAVDNRYEEAHRSKKGYCHLCFDSSECLPCHNYYLHFLTWRDWLGSGICQTTWKDRAVYQYEPFTS